MNNIYLDWAATTPVHKDVLSEFLHQTEENFGNPSSVHAFGTNSREMLENLRTKASEILNVPDRSLVFTSGGTESNLHILHSFLLKKQPGELLVSAIEHSSIKKQANVLKNFGFTIKEIPVTPRGIIDLNKLPSLITEDTRGVFTMAVNNEIGSIQPVKEADAIIRQKEKEFGRPIHHHTDGVQALGKIPIQLKEWNIDSASFSAHKIQGPKGTGLLYLKKEVPLLSAGGSQEMGLRPGTENLAGIAAFIKAMEIFTPNSTKSKELESLIFESLNSIPEITIIPKERTAGCKDYVSNIIPFSMPPLPGEVIVRLLSDKGIAISTGSACSSKDQKKIGIAQIMGYSKEIADSFLRLSTGPSTTREEIIQCMDGLKKIIEEHRFLYKSRR